MELTDLVYRVNALTTWATWPKPRMRPYWASGSRQIPRLGIFEAQILLVPSHCWYPCFCWLTQLTLPELNIRWVHPVKLKSQFWTKPFQAVTLPTALPSEPELLHDPSALGASSKLWRTVRSEMGNLTQGLGWKEGKREVEIDFQRQPRGLPIPNWGGNLQEASSSLCDHPARPARADYSVNSSAALRDQHLWFLGCRPLTGLYLLGTAGLSLLSQHVRTYLLELSDQMRLKEKHNTQFLNNFIISRWI